MGSSEVSFLQFWGFKPKLPASVGQSGIFGGFDLAAWACFAVPHRVGSLWFVRVPDQGFEEKTKCSFQVRLF